MEVDVDYAANMLQVPNPNTETNYADSVGGGFTNLEMSENGSLTIGTFTGAGADITTFMNFHHEAKFSNGTWQIVSSMDNPEYVAQQYTDHGATLGSRVLNYPTGFVKYYSEARGGFIIPAGAKFDIERTFRIAPV